MTEPTTPDERELYLGVVSHAEFRTPEGEMVADFIRRLIADIDQLEAERDAFRDAFEDELRRRHQQLVVAERHREDAERLAAALHWALDLIDMYDARLVKLGDPEELVRSPVHLAGKRKARGSLRQHEGG